MSESETPCLTLAIARLCGQLNNHSPLPEEHFATWVLQAPSPGGYAHHDCIWPESLTQSWLKWQEMFKLRGLPHVPFVHNVSQQPQNPPEEPDPSTNGQMPISSRLMQEMGIKLWQWLFDGSLKNSFAQSQGFAIGQNKPLRLRLEIRDPNLIPLPWEIMQPLLGLPAVSLSPQILLSRTTSDVYPLQPLPTDQALNILVVLGKDTLTRCSSSAALKLQQEASALTQILKNHPSGVAVRENYTPPVPCYVHTLVQPTPEELINVLETKNYNVLFYGGHGAPGPDGGLLFLGDATLNGTELAQVLVRCQVKLAVFNACWSAQPDTENQQARERSSLAEVLIHHGVPAVVGMQDSIADREALTFIQAFAQALAERMPIDRAVAVARQQLLTIYKFNQPAWTLPVLYMHPQFDGALLKPIGELITTLPNPVPRWIGQSIPEASLRLLEENGRCWLIRGNRLRVGRSPDNDMVIEQTEVSRKHAEIFYRDINLNEYAQPTYFLRDNSSFGTFILRDNCWEKVHHQEVPLQSGVRLKFGSTENQTLEFIINGDRS